MHYGIVQTIKILLHIFCLGLLDTLVEMYMQYTKENFTVLYDLQ